MRDSSQRPDGRRPLEGRGEQDAAASERDGEQSEGGQDERERTAGSGKRAEGRVPEQPDRRGSDRGRAAWRGAPASRDGVFTASGPLCGRRVACRRAVARA